MRLTYSVRHDKAKHHACGSGDHSWIIMRFMYIMFINYYVDFMRVCILHQKMVLFDFLFIILYFVRLAVLDFLYKLDTKKRFSATFLKGKIVLYPPMVWPVLTVPTSDLKVIT